MRPAYEQFAEVAPREEMPDTMLLGHDLSGGLVGAQAISREDVVEAMRLIRRQSLGRDIDDAALAALRLSLVSVTTLEEAAWVAQLYRWAGRELYFARGMHYPDYLRSFAWSCVRDDTLALMPRCVLCATRGLGLTVHHLTYDRRGYEHPSDLATLCASCHRQTHSLGWKAPTPS